jgi:S1-C subfamily serine protease
MKVVRGFFSIFVLLAICQSLVAAGSIFSYNEDDFKEAKKSAENGDADAQLAIGIMFDLGQGIPQNFTEALKWYTRAAIQGNAKARNNLGVMYLEGKGTPQNLGAAAKWILISANQGYAKAQMNLGFLFADGNGMPRNSVLALYWLRKAAEQGGAAEETALGNIYVEGKIVNWDYVEAYKWFILASAQGDPQAIKARDELAQKMSVQGIGEAQQRATAFAPAKAPSDVDLATGSGTGFFVTQDGYMLTANHVVDGASKIIVKTKYLALAARVVKVDKTNDVALLKVTGAYPPSALTNEMLLRGLSPRLSPVANSFRPLRVANSSEVRLGDSVSTLGFPNPDLQGNAPKFTRGEINSLAGLRDDPHHFQVSAPIQPGNSGGPLLDHSGAVVGLVQSTLNDARQLIATGLVPQNVNYALKSEYLLRFLKSTPGVVLKEGPAEASGGPPNDWVSDSQSSIAVVLVY